jgi:hypothetical protein
VNLKLIGGPKDGEVIEIPPHLEVNFKETADRITANGILYYKIHCIDGEYIGQYEEPEDAV